MKSCSILPFLVLLTLFFVTNALTDVKIDNGINNEEIPMMDPRLYDTEYSSANDKNINSESEEPTFEYGKNIKHFNANNQIIEKAYEKCISTCSVANV